VTDVVVRTWCKAGAEPGDGAGRPGRLPGGAGLSGWLRRLAWRGLPRRRRAGLPGGYAEPVFSSATISPPPFLVRLTTASIPSAGSRLASGWRLTVRAEGTGGSRRRFDRTAEPAGRRSAATTCDPLAFGSGSPSDLAVTRRWPVNRAYNLPKNTWPSRTTMEIPSPTMDDPEMGPKARESQEAERLSPSTKYWFWASVVLAIGLEPTWP